MPDDLRLEAALTRLIMLGSRMADLLTTIAQDEFTQALYRRHAERNCAAWHAAMDELNESAIVRSQETIPRPTTAETAVA